MRKRLLTTVGIATVLLLAEGIWVYAFLPGAADASRNSSGTYSTPNTFVTGTQISSTSVNANFADIATEMTDSLDRSGKGPMLAPLRLTNGSNAAPSLTFDSDTDVGFYRIGADNPGLTVAGSKRQEWSTTGTTVTGTTTSTGVIKGPDGAVGGPGFAFTSEANGTGFYMGAAQSMRAAANGGEVQRWEPTKTTIMQGLQVGSAGTSFAAIKKATVVWDPGATGAGGCAAGTTASVTNIALGDVCWATSGVSPGAAWTTCEVTSAGTVTVNICAFTNTDIASSTWTIWTLQATN